jgi:hypothetical protein
MGVVSQFASELQNGEAANEILVRTGLFQRCPSCNVTFGRIEPGYESSDLTAAHNLADDLFRIADPLGAGLDVGHQALTL